MIRNVQFGSVSNGYSISFTAPANLPSDGVYFLAVLSLGVTPSGDGANTSFGSGVTWTWLGSPGAHWWYTRGLAAGNSVNITFPNATTAVAILFIADTIDVTNLAGITDGGSISFAPPAAAFQSVTMSTSVVPTSVIQLVTWYGSNVQGNPGFASFDSGLAVTQPPGYISPDGIGVALGWNYFSASTPGYSFQTFLSQPTLNETVALIFVPGIVAAAASDFVSFVEEIGNGPMAVEGIAFADALTIDYIASDAITMTDIATFTLAAPDSIAFSDLPVLSFPPGVVDSITFTDSVAISDTLADYFTFVEAVSLLIGVTATDNVALTDAASMTADYSGVPATTFITFTDTPTLLSSLVVSDTITMVDVPGLGAAAVADFIGFYDGPVIYLLDKDGRIVCDKDGTPIILGLSVQVQTALAATDTVSMADALVPAFEVADAISFVDTLTGNQFAVADAISFVDASTVGITVADYLTAADATMLTIAVSGTDAISFTEGLSLAANYASVPVADSIGFSDVLTFQPAFLLADNVVMSDSPALALATLTTVFDSITMGDSGSTAPVFAPLVDNIAFSDAASVAVLAGS